MTVQTNLMDDSIEEVIYVVSPFVGMSTFHLVRNSNVRIEVDKEDAEQYMWAGVPLTIVTDYEHDRYVIDPKNNPYANITIIPADKVFTFDEFVSYYIDVLETTPETDLHNNTINQFQLLVRATSALANDRMTYDNSEVEQPQSHELHNTTRDIATALIDRLIHEHVFVANEDQPVEQNGFARADKFLSEMEHNLSRRDNTYTSYLLQTYDLAQQALMSFVVELLEYIGYEGNPVYTNLYQVNLKFINEINEHNKHTTSTQN